MRIRTTIPAAAALLLALTACSSGDNDTAEPTATPETSTSAAEESPAAEDDQSAALEEAVRAYTAAYFKPDVDAGYAMLSARCQAAAPKEAYAAAVERAATANVNKIQYKVERFAIDRISGDMATVTYGVGDPLYDQKGQPWVRESGDWKYDSC